MASFSRTIKNLFGGVSQAPDVQRDASQFSELVNTIGAWGKRLGRRPGTRHIATVQDGSFVYEFGAYTVVVADDGSVHVFERATGDAQTVNNFLTSSYLGDGSALRAVTVGDTMYVLNTTVKTLKDNAGWFTAYPTAHVTVAVGDYETAYSIQVGSSTYTHTTPAATVAGAKAAIQTTSIATALRLLVCPVGGTNADGFTCTQFGSVLIIKKVTLPIDFTIQVTDGLAGNGLKLVKDTVKAPEDLPAIGEIGTVVKVIGQAGIDADDYWVSLVSSPAFIYGSDIWKEAREPASLYKLDEDTLPVKIWRDPATGFFEVRTCPWADRMVGGDVSNPFPSFIGHTINDLFVISGRLGFISGSRVTLSEAGNLFNFFRTSTTQVLSSDPIDVDAAISGATDFVHALNWRKAVYLFTDRAQFILQGGRDGLTAESISVTQASAYPSDTSVRPVVVGQRIFFVAQEEGSPHVMDYHMKQYVEEHEAIDVTVDVPTYITGVPFMLAADEALGYLFLTTSSGIYVYAFRDTDSGRVQSAWSRWEFPDGLVRSMAIIDRTLWLVKLFLDGTATLEMLPLHEGAVGTQTFLASPIFNGSGTFNGARTFNGGGTVALDVLGERIGLDRRVNGADLSYSYDATHDVSVWTLPYTVALNGSGGVPAGWDVTTGQYIQLSQPAPNKVSAKGDYTFHTVLLGTLFTTEIVLSTLYERDRDGDVDDRGRLQLRFVTLDTADTNEIDVWVEVAGRDAVGYSRRNALPSDGTFTFPVQARNTDTRISIGIQGPGAFFLTSYSWEGTNHTRVPRR